MLCYNVKEVVGMLYAVCIFFGTGALCGEPPQQAGETPKLAYSDQYELCSSLNRAQLKLLHDFWKIVSETTCYEMAESAAVDIEKLIEKNRELTALEQEIEKDPKLAALYESILDETFDTAWEPVSESIQQRGEELRKMTPPFFGSKKFAEACETLWVDLFCYPESVIVE